MPGMEWAVYEYMESDSPCPFCGHDWVELSILDDRRLDDKYRNPVRVECERCLACVIGDNEADALRRWNRRAGAALRRCRLGISWDSNIKMRRCSNCDEMTPVTSNFCCKCGAEVIE